MLPSDTKFGDTKYYSVTFNSAKLSVLYLDRVNSELRARPLFYTLDSGGVS